MRDQGLGDAKAQRAEARLIYVVVVIFTVIPIVVAIGSVYVLLHFVVKYW